MKALRRRESVISLALGGLLVWPVLAAAASRGGGYAPSGCAQDPQESSSKRPADQEPGAAPDANAPANAKKDQSSSSKKTTAPEPAPPASPQKDDPVSIRINNTAKAEHDVEVGKYYEKRDKFDAAIDRYKEAAELVPTYALPHKLMGEAYERKHFLPEALSAYEKYLKVAPTAGDAEDVRKRVARLRAQIEEEDRRRASATKP